MREPYGKAVAPRISGDFRGHLTKLFACAGLLCGLDCFHAKDSENSGPGAVFPGTGDFRQFPGTPH